MNGLSVMPLHVGCITTQTTCGPINTTNYLKVMFSVAWTLMTDHRPNHGQHVAVNPRPLREYNVTLSSGEVIYILARSSEQAAWSALELAADRTLKLVDVRQTDEW